MKRCSLPLILMIEMILLMGCQDSSYKYDNGNLDATFKKQPAAGTQNAQPSTQQEKDKLLSEGWEDKSMQNGAMPDCYNFKPQTSTIDNALHVSVGSGTDVAIKLMNLKADKCVRYVFINRSSTFSINHIPEGIYYLKLAYGKDWLSKVKNNQCIGRFIRQPVYEKGTEELDFNIHRTAHGYSIPSYSLQLDVISRGVSNSFRSDKISENEFNQ